MSEAYLGRARARALKVVENFNQIIESGKQPRTGEEHRIAILQYLLAVEHVRDLDLDGLPPPHSDAKQFLEVLNYRAERQTNDPAGVWLDSLDADWKSHRASE